MYPTAISAKRTTRVNTVTDPSAVVFLLHANGTDWLHAGVSG
jgi:hypothetical protein